jgi:hypothetical protein
MTDRSAAVAAARILLLERRDTVARRDPDGAFVRRYRLARLRVDGRPAGSRARFEHLKRAYD